MDFLVKSFVLCGLVAFCGSTGSYMLPKAIVPQHYRLELLVNLGDTDNKFEFHGNVWIKVTCLEDAANITLHSKQLDIDKNSIAVYETKDEAKKHQVADISEDKENDFYTIQLTPHLNAKHEYTIHMKYKGLLKDVLSGFYRSSYIDKATKKTRYLATTQFESTDARRAIPCFDEPAMKAKWEISLGHKEKYTALSNMPELKKEAIKDQEGFVWTRFEETVPISTYLIAFIVSDFEHKTSPKGDNNVTFKIWSRKDAIGQVEFAKDIGPKFLSYYEDFFNIKYPLPKQDMVAIPDFSAGAMENWGLITYREVYLLYDPEISTSSSQHGVASVIAHELAHQWFGNLVTMKWWTDLWLNEGFATYMAAIAVDNIFPQWNSLEEETANNLMTVFSFDALHSSHPVSVPVGHPREIDQIFDTISYKKGSFILRMMSLFLGEKTLRKGVSNYLEKHKFSNAEQDDLWASLTEQAHKDGSFPKHMTVKEVMDTWTLQTGYPMITAKRHYGSNKVDLKQARYISSNIKTKGDRAQCWYVPISYTTQSQLDFNATHPKNWLPCTEEAETIEIEHNDDAKWLILNVQAAGLFRVNYDDKNWNMLIATLNSDKYQDLPVLNRVQLIDDSSHLSFTGDLNYEVFFNLFNYMKYEAKYLPWKAALKNIGYLNRQLKRSSHYGLFKSYLKNVLTPIYKKLGKLQLSRATLEHLDIVKHQALVATWACKFKVDNCVEDAKTKYQQFKKDPKDKESVPKDLRGLIYCNAIREGGETEWDYLWKKYLASNVAQEKSTILSSLACTTEIWLLRRYLDWTLKPDSGIRQQDYASVFADVASNEVGFYVAQNFLQENIKDIHESMAGNTRRLSRYLNPLAAQMSTESDYDWMHNLTSTHEEQFKEAKQGVEQSLEKIRLNIQWQQKHSAEVKKFLEKHNAE